VGAAHQIVDLRPSRRRVLGEEPPWVGQRRFRVGQLEKSRFEQPTLFRPVTQPAAGPEVIVQFGLEQLSQRRLFAAAVAAGPFVEDLIPDHRAGVRELVGRHGR
jgi:hypothetical protein